MGDNSQIEGKPVYIFSGLRDSVVPPRVQEQQKSFYEELKANVLLDAQDYNHNVPRIGYDCLPEDTQWVIDLIGDFVGNSFLKTCGYDAAGEMYKFLYPNLKESPIETVNPPDLDWRSNGVLRKFSQTELIDANVGTETGLDEHGYVYYPFSCKEKACNINFFFHGCQQTIRFRHGQGWDVVTKYRFNDYAASNDIIQIFP